MSDSFKCGMEECLEETLRTIPFSGINTVLSACDTFSDNLTEICSSQPDAVDKVKNALNANVENLLRDGGNCTHMCDYLMGLLKKRLNLENCYIFPSWRDVLDPFVGHVSIFVPLSSSELFPFAILDPGMYIRKPVVMKDENSCAVMDDFEFKCAKVPESGEFVVVGRRLTPGKFNNVYAVTRKSVSMYDRASIVKGFLKRCCVDFLSRRFEDRSIELHMQIDLGVECIKLNRPKQFAEQKGDHSSESISIPFSHFGSKAVLEQVLNDHCINFDSVESLWELIQPSRVKKLQCYARLLKSPSILPCGSLSKRMKGPHLVKFPEDVEALSICRCGECDSFPLSEVGCSNVFKVKHEMFGSEVSQVKVCGCGLARGRKVGRPWCDGSHAVIQDMEDIGSAQATLFSSTRNTMYNWKDLISLPSYCFEEAKLDMEQIHSFMEKGFCVLPSVIPSDLIGKALKQVNIMFANSIIRQEETEGFKNTTLRPTGNKKLFSVTKHHILDLLPPILPFLNFLFSGTENYEYPQEAQLAVRFPMDQEVDEVLDPQDWHVDDIFDCFLPPFSLLVGIPLSDWESSWKGNFTLFSGSHFQVNELVRTDYQGFVDNYKLAQHPALDDPVQICCKAGDVFLAHPLAAHRAGPNYSPFIRNALYFRITSKWKAAASDLILNSMWMEFPPLQNLRSGVGQT
jgi:CDGSH-type Zn-finger protein